MPRLPEGRDASFYRVDMHEIRDANARRGHHFFEAATMRFFRSRAAQTGYRGPGGTFFVTSEQFVDSRGNRAPRRYTVREQRPDGDIFTVGQFNVMGRRGADALALRCAVFGVDGREDAGNVPCVACGRDDLPLHYNRRCAACGIGEPEGGQS